MSERIIIKQPVTWEASNRLKDRSVSIRLQTTGETSTEDLTIMDKAYGTTGWLLYIGNEEHAIDDDLIPTEDAPGKETKPKILRLRGVKWHLWNQTPSLKERFPDFESYWAWWFEELMSNEKAKLD